MSDEPDHDQESDELSDADALQARQETAVSDAVGALVDLFVALSERGEAVACAKEAAAAATTFAEVGTPWKLQVVPPVIFLNGELAVVTPEAMTSLRQLATALDVAGVGFLESETSLDGDEWLSFASAFVVAARGDRTALAKFGDGVLRFGQHPAGRAGGDPKQFDVETYTHKLLNDAIDLAAEIGAPTSAWDWGRAVAAIRSIEQAHAANSAACLRALELHSESWSGSRGAVMMALHTLRTLQILSVTPLTRRVVAHTAYTLGAHGLLEGVGRPLKEAAKMAFEDMMAHFAPASLAQGEGTSHEARVMALLRVLSADTVVMAALGGPLPLVRILYEMQRHRMAQDASQRPSGTDLLAYIAAAEDQGFDRKWLAALIRSAGGLVIGTSVRMPDGTVGIAADPGRSGHVMRPVVMHGSGFVTPDAPVVPIPW